MKTRQRKRALWASIAGLLVIGAAVTSLLVMASGNDIAFTASTYSDVIRFTADGVSSLQIRIYDMAENELWDSGQIRMDFVDWDRSNEWGERLANGYYIYFVQGWSTADEVILAKTGKVVLLPGDQVQLQSAPVVASPPTQDEEWREEPTFSPMMYTINDDLTVNGTITSQESGGAGNFLKVYAGGTGNRAAFTLYGYNASNFGDYATFTMRTDKTDAVFSIYDNSAATWHPAYSFKYLSNLFDFKGNIVENVGVLGVGGPYTFAGGPGTLELYDNGSGFQIVMFDPGGGSHALDRWANSLLFWDSTWNVNAMFEDGAYGGLHLASNSGAAIGTGMAWAPRGGLEVSTFVSGLPVELYLDDTTPTGINQIYFDAYDTDWMIGVHGTTTGPYLWPGILTFSDQVRCPSGLHGLALWYDTGATTYRAEFGNAFDACDVMIFGNYTATGTKSFVMPDPDDPGRSIYYAAMEGPEAGTYIRGSAELTGGEAVIHLPDHFAKVSSDAGLTVIVTPVGDWLQLYVVEKSTTTIVVREASGKDGTFDYRVEGVRSGYEDFAVYRDSIALPAAFPEVSSTNGVADPTFAPDGQVTVKIPVNIPSK